MKNEVIRKRIFQKSGEIYQKKKNSVVRKNLNIKKNTQFIAGKIFFFKCGKIYRKNQIHDKEKRI